MTADEEDNYKVGQANEPLDEQGRFVNRRVVVRWRDETIEVPADQVDYIDVSPKQVVSVATAMIPFLENDDANRALMGSQHAASGRAAAGARSALSWARAWNTRPPTIPALCCFAKHARRRHLAWLRMKSSFRMMTAKSTAITLSKFVRSNQGTCINQRPWCMQGGAGRGGRCAGGRPLHRQGRNRPGPQHAHRLYDLGGL